VLELVPRDRPVSIERDVFPRLAEEGSVYGLALDGYWLDVGTPESYLQAHRDVLERSFPTEVGKALGSDFTLIDETAHVEPGARLVPPVYVGPDATVEAGARAGSLAVIGAGARVGAGAIVENSVLGSRSSIGVGAVLVGSVVGDNATIGDASEVRNLAVVGPGSKLGRGNTLDHGLRVSADQTIPDEALNFS
jgi:mannose-1-phosphate guanylyltransferase